MTHAAIAVFTGNSTEEILAAGGSASWVLSEKNARRQAYLVGVRNAREATFAEHEPHGTAFLVGKISGLRHFGFDKKGLPRWTIEISEYAPLAIPDVWGNWRNPVKYTTLEELGIELKSLKFQPLPARDATAEALPPPKARRPLTIAEAKEGLALQFGVAPEAIDILIRG